MHDVFISYSHNDVQIADAICHKLESDGIRCWYAPRNIQPGQEWADAIIAAIEQCRIMILVFTDSSNVSRQVHREVDTAINSGKAIIPFKCSETAPSGSMKYYLSTLHWLDAMTPPLEESIRHLCSLTHLMLDNTTKSGESAPVSDARKTAPSEKQTAPVQKQNRRSRLGILLPAVLIGAAILAVGILLTPKLIRAMQQSADPTAAPTQDAAQIDAPQSEPATQKTAEPEASDAAETAAAAEVQTTAETQPTAAADAEPVVIAYNKKEMIDVYNPKDGKLDYRISVDNVHRAPEAILSVMWEDYDAETLDVLSVQCSVECIRYHRGDEGQVQLYQIVQDDTLLIEDPDGFLLQSVERMWQGLDGQYPAATNISIPAGSKGRFAFLFYVEKGVHKVKVTIQSHGNVTAVADFDI